MISLRLHIFVIVFDETFFGFFSLVKPVEEEKKDFVNVEQIDKYGFFEDNLEISQQKYTFKFVMTVRIKNTKIFEKSGKDINQRILKEHWNSQKSLAPEGNTKNGNRTLAVS